MSGVTIKEWYRRVEATWPAGELPPLSAVEAVRAGRKLYRFAFGSTWTRKVYVGSGNRRNWIEGGVLTVNPDRGWHDLVHDLGHYAHWRLLPDVRPHGADHARLEIRMIKEVVRRGWLAGALRDAPPPAPPSPEVAAAAVREQRLAALDARIRRWQSKSKRALTALRKLARAKRRLERRAGP